LSHFEGGRAIGSLTSESVSGAARWRARLGVRREALARRDEGAVEHQHKRVEVWVEIESTAEALREGHGAGA